MLRPFRNRARVLSAALATGFVALWFASFASACMAATGPACEMPGSGCAKHEVVFAVAPCEQAVAPCELPQLNAPVAGQFDLPVVAILTETIASSFVVPQVVRTPPEDWRATRPTSTPLYLTYLALLN